MPRIDKLLRRLRELGASDLHMTTGQHPRYRVHGHLDPDKTHPVLDDMSMREYLFGILEPRHREAWDRLHDVDFAYGIEGVARFRCNYFQDNSGMGAVFRLIPDRIVPLAELNLPEAVGRFAELRQGLVLVTGPTGSGKSTTLAAIVNQINETKKKHIVTIEDPIEFVHQNKKCVITHREVGHHTKSFAAALRAAIRQDPDVILVGEMRDLETIALAITAAEMGLLVFATLHTNSAPKTIDRIVDVFPAEQQPQIRAQLSESLAGIVSQLLLRTKDGEGRVAVNEILVATSGLANIIREGSISKIASVIQQGRAEGMQSMDQALMDLVKAGTITGEEAYMKCHDKKAFEKYVELQ